MCANHVLPPWSKRLEDRKSSQRYGCKAVRTCVCGSANIQSAAGFGFVPRRRGRVRTGWLAPEGAGSTAFGVGAVVATAGATIGAPGVMAVILPSSRASGTAAERQSRRLAFRIGHDDGEGRSLLSQTTGAAWLSSTDASDSRKIPSPRGCRRDAAIQRVARHAVVTRRGRKRRGLVRAVQAHHAAMRRDSQKPCLRRVGLRASSWSNASKRPRRVARAWRIGIAFLQQELLMKLKLLSGRSPMCRRSYNKLFKC